MRVIMHVITGDLLPVRHLVFGMAAAVFVTPLQLFPVYGCNRGPKAWNTIYYLAVKFKNAKAEQRTRSKNHSSLMRHMPRAFLTSRLQTISLFPYKWLIKLYLITRMVIWQRKRASMSQAKWPTRLLKSLTIPQKSERLAALLVTSLKN